MSEHRQKRKCDGVAFLCKSLWRIAIVQCVICRVLWVVVSQLFTGPSQRSSSPNLYDILSQNTLKCTNVSGLFKSLTQSSLSTFIHLAEV